MRRSHSSLPLFAALLIGCGPDTLTVPTVPAIAAPTPAPIVLTPTTVRPGGLSVTWSEGACFSVTNHNDVAAGLAAYYTTFDGPTEYEPVAKPHLPPGESWGWCYNRGCIQVDVDQPGVKELGGYWFDSNQRPFDPELEPAKIVACRAPRTPPTPPTPVPTPLPICREDGPPNTPQTPCRMPWES